MSELPPNPLPLPGQPDNVTPTVEAEEKTERRVPARMKPGELPLDDDSLFLMPWHLMWPDYDG
jgi:hypothetical protein